MLCETCNKLKGSLILRPDDYLKYLKEDDLKKLQGYFDSYTASFEYISRGNLFSCDQYRMQVEPDIKMRNTSRRLRHTPNNHVLLKKATVDDMLRISDYFEKYLKKYECFNSRRVVELNIQFWLQFGCIYYIESLDGIKVIAAITVTDFRGKKEKEMPKYALSISVFPYYDTQYSLTLCVGLMNFISRCITEEQGLIQLPLRLNMVKKDKLSSYIVGDSPTIKEASVDPMLHQYIIMHTGKKEELPNPDDDESLQAFFQKFANVEEEVKHWIGDEKDIEWMMEEMIRTS